jgi:hypothetical protein
MHATGHALHYQMIAEPSFLLRNNYAEAWKRDGTGNHNAVAPRGEYKTIC